MGSGTPAWLRASRVTSGYSSTSWDCPYAFAFRPASGKFRTTLYGTQNDDGIVTSLMFKRVTRAEANLLRAFGKGFGLIRVDMGQAEVIDLMDDAAIA